MSEMDNKIMTESVKILPWLDWNSFLRIIICDDDEQKYKCYIS